MSDSKKNIILAILGISILGITIVYAALSTNLRITGTATVSNTEWDIKLKNITSENTPSTVTIGDITHSNTADPGVLPTIINNTAITNLAVTLYQPGDKAVYDFDIVNEGTLDAKLSSCNLKMLTNPGSNVVSSTSAQSTPLMITGGTDENNDDAFKTTLDCTSHNAVGTTLAKNNGTEHCTLTVEYSNVSNQNQNTAGSNQVYTKNAKTINIEANWVYVQK